jgi:DNA-binding NarL/FixJ family response regulator
MFDLHEVVVIDGNEFTRALLSNIFNHPKMRNRVEHLAELSGFHLLTEEQIKSLNPSFITFNFQSCVQDLEKYLVFIKKINPNIRVIACYFSESQFEINLLIKAGVNAIIGNHHDPICILNAMDSLRTQEHFVNDIISNEILAKAKRKLWIEDDGMTLLEISVMRLISIGFSREQVAKLLGREKHTIENAISIIHSKTATKNDLQISRYAILHGFLDSGLRNASNTQKRIIEIENM